MTEREFAAKREDIKHKLIKQRLFGIPFDFTILTTAGSSYKESYTISTNYDFLWEQTLSVKLSTTGLPDSEIAPAIRDVSLQIRDEFTSEDMFVSPIFLSQVTGDGKNQNIMPSPYLFNGGTTITLTVVDTFGGASGFRLQVTLLGYKVKSVK